MAVFSMGAVRQFCAFAIVVLVAHWFLAHTFFLAVLSIDIQRLEVCAEPPKPSAFIISFYFFSYRSS
jgi:Sterol-sensing domain of SREBP cleavage-activation